jgi:hypothetical protein
MFPFSVFERVKSRKIGKFDVAEVDRFCPSYLARRDLLASETELP